MTAHSAFAHSTSSAAAPRKEGYSAGRLLRFSALGIPIAASQMPIGVYLPPIFAKLYGLSLGTIGLIFLIGRLWDGLLDPVVGTLSDATRSRFGRRRPWIVGGTMLFLVATVLLFFPLASVTPAYLASALLLFYVGWTAMQIPMLAWSGEISAQYHQRTRIATYQMVISSLGLFLALVLPSIAEKLRPGDAQLQLTLMGGLLLVTTLPALFLSITAVPEAPAPQQAERFSLGEALRAVFANPLLLRVLASDFAVTLGQGVRGALIVFFVGFYMGRPDWAATLFLLQFVFGILAAPIWGRIGRAIGKSRAAALGEVAQALINFALLTVTPSTFWLLLTLTVAQGLTQGSGNLMLRAIVADVADKHRLETGEERSGLYYSVFTLSAKVGGAAAIGVALPLVAWLGFDPTASANDPAALDGLLYVFALGPALAHTLAAFLIARFPLDENAHAEIRRRLDAGLTPLVPAE